MRTLIGALCSVLVISGCSSGITQSELDKAVADAVAAATATTTTVLLPKTAPSPTRLPALTRWQTNLYSDSVLWAPAWNEAVDSFNNGNEAEARAACATAGQKADQVTMEVETGYSNTEFRTLVLTVLHAMDSAFDACVKGEWQKASDSAELVRSLYDRLYAFIGSTN